MLILSGKQIYDNRIFPFTKTREPFENTRKISFNDEHREPSPVLDVFALNEAGEMTEVPFTYEDGEAKFAVDSFSKYVVTCDAAK